MPDPPDFTERAHLEEQMDSLPFAQYRTCLHDLDAVSRTVLAHRPTLKFLNRLIALHPDQPLRILDVACGDGAMLRRIAHWAKRRKLNVELTGLDLNPNAIAVAHEFPRDSIQYRVTDVFAYIPEPQPDVILSAHFTHHLTDLDLLRFLQWMEQHARIGWFINDLHRHPNPYRLFRLLGAVAPWHRIVVADGLISIRRAFTVQDWHRLLAVVAVPEASVTEEFPARLTVARLRPNSAAAR